MNLIKMSSYIDLIVDYAKDFFKNMYQFNEKNFKGYNKVINDQVTSLFSSILIPIYLIIWLLFFVILLVLKLIQKISWTVFCIVSLISIVIIWDISLIGSYLIRKNLNKITSTFNKQLIEPYTTEEFEKFIESCVFKGGFSPGSAVSVSCNFPTT